MPDLSDTPALRYGAIPFLIFASAILYDAAVLRSSKEMLLARMMAARWLGAGRATEAYLSLTAAIAGVFLIWVPNTFGFSFGVPLLIKAILSGSGIVMNVIGKRVSAIVLRFSGGLLGGIIWARLLIEVGETNVISGGCETITESLSLVAAAFCITSMIFSAREMAMALADIPHSGADNGMARD